MVDADLFAGPLKHSAIVSSRNDLMTHPLSEMDDKTRDEIKSKLLNLPGAGWDQTLRRMVRTR